LTVNGTLTLTGGILDPSSVNNFTIGVSSSWLNTGGVFLPQVSTVSFVGTTAGLFIKSNGSNFANVLVNGAGGYWTMLDSMTLTSTMTITGGTLNTGSGNNAILVGRNWRNSVGAFIANQSTVTFNGTVSNEKIFSNGSPFNNIEFMAMAEPGFPGLHDGHLFDDFDRRNAEYQCRQQFWHVRGGDWLNNGASLPPTSVQSSLMERQLDRK